MCTSKTLYAGTIDALRTIGREEGLGGMYRGLLPQLALVSNGALQFMLYEEIKAWLAQVRILMILACFFLRGRILRVDYVRRANTGRFGTDWRGVIRSTGQAQRSRRPLCDIGLQGECNSSCVLVSAKLGTCRCCSVISAGVELLCMLMCAVWPSAQVIASTATYPMQVIRTVMQDPSRCVQGLYRASLAKHRCFAYAHDATPGRCDAHCSGRHHGVVSSAKGIYRKAGVRGFYGGLLPNLVRVLPHTLVVFATYEYVRGMSVFV
jgi:hypothetical protein